jgi:uncharacterized Zn finger protein
MTCPTCGLEAEVTDGVFGIHRNTGLLRCDNSGQPAKQELETKVEEPKIPEEPKPVKKAAPRRKKTS